MKKAWLLPSSICMILVATLAAGTFWQLHRKAALSERILRRIDRMVLHSPDDVTDLEWAVLVYWTHNLHGNSQLVRFTTYADLIEFEARLRQIADAQDYTVSSIDEIWNLYGQVSNDAARYRDKYKAVRDSVARDAREQGDEYFDQRSYREFLEYVRRHQFDPQ